MIKPILINLWLIIKSICFGILIGLYSTGGICLIGLALDLQQDCYELDLIFDVAAILGIISAISFAISKFYSYYEQRSATK